MKTKRLIFTISILLFVTACINQQPNLKPTVELAGTTVENQMITPTALSTEKPNIVRLMTSTPVITVVPKTNTPETETQIPKNALIAFSKGLKGIYISSPFGGTSTPIIAGEVGSIYFSPSWSPDGKKIVFEKDSTIYIVKKDGSDLHILRDEKGIDQFSPIWSPDGEHIVYRTSFGLIITNQEGKDFQKLIEPASGVLFPAWSPDGKQLAFLSSPTGDNNTYKILLINNDGTNPESITESIVGASPLSWSPDGKKIAFSSFINCGDINVLDLKTRIITNLTNTPNVIEQDPAWSPDGSYIAFIKAVYTPCDHYYGGDLFIMDKNGQQQTSLSQSGLQPSWWPVTLLKAGWKYRITLAGANLNIRDAASTLGKSLVKLQQDDIFIVLNGPVAADNYQWWRIRTYNGIEGWCVDVPGWYIFESAPEPSP